MKFIATLIFLLFLTIPSFADKQADQMFNPVVQINGNCSGTVFSSKFDPKTKKTQTLILTAKHCTQEMGAGELVEVEVQKYNENLSQIGSVNYIGNVVIKSNFYDLAVVLLKDTNVILPSAKIGNGPYEFGQQVWAVGFPAGLSKTSTVGTLGYREYIPKNNIPSLPSGENMSVGDNEYQRSTAAIRPGSSGGPLFTQDKDGNYVLIGVASMVIGQSEFMALYTPIDQINQFLSQFKW